MRYNPYQEEFERQLRAYIEQSGRSQTWTAKQLGYRHRAILLKWMTGDAQMPLKALHEFCALFGLDAGQAIELIKLAGHQDVLALLDKPPEGTPPSDPAEESYRQRIKGRYALDAPYYIPLAGETTELIAPQVAPQAPRSARRRQARAMAEYCEWVQTGQEVRWVRLNTLRDGVDKYPCLILLGEPGSGKTTALENLAYQLADEPEHLPLPLRLSEFGPGLTVEAFIEQGWGGAEPAGYWGMPELAANLPRYLEAGRLFILFDALNEMPHQGYAERVQALRHFIDRWSLQGNRFLVTCRVLDYGEELSGLQRVEVLPLNGDQVREFLQKELPETWPVLWEKLADESAGERRLLEMARNPYILTMMIDVFMEDGQLGENRAELMGRFTEILLGWAKAKCAPTEWLDAEVLRESLAVLAFEMQYRAGSGARVKTAQVKAVLPAQVQPNPAWPPVAAPPDQVLALATKANLIEMSGDHSSVCFYHQLLQEYFAAHALLKQVKTNPKAFQNPATLGRLWRWPWLETEMPRWIRRLEGYWGILPPPPPTGWEETIILAASLAIENDNQLVRALLVVNPVLAGHCLHEGQAKVDRATREAVIKALLATITWSEVALRVRIAAGDVLGYLGDPRLGELVTVPAGKFWMGEGKTQHQLFLPEYRIGKYPVTNTEYTRFVEAGGYRQKRWWTETGWQARGEKDPPDYWRHAYFNKNKPNQPMVGVSWYEAVAYCRWLSTETGLVYRLPTEAEWEKAARGTDGRIFPWGNEFEPSRLNAAEGGQIVQTTTPVGIYPGGISPFGLLDCAGNVWECCATKAEKDYPYDTGEDEWGADYLEGDGLRMVRGGSFSHFQGYARCPLRYWYEPLRIINLGFRLSCQTT